MSFHRVDLRRCRVARIALVTTDVVRAQRLKSVPPGSSSDQRGAIRVFLRRFRVARIALVTR